MTLFTPEQTKEALEKAKLKREAGIALYRNDFADDEYWMQLAKQYKLLLPKWFVAPEVAKMRSWLRKVGIKERDYREACSEGWVLEDFALLNPNWPLRAFVGILLEYRHELDNAKAINNQHTHRS